MMSTSPTKPAIRPIGQIGVGEKVGFGLGDFACNLIYASLSSYLLFFYTNVFGITAAAASFLFLVVRFVDALSDPIIGFLWINPIRAGESIGRFYYMERFHLPFWPSCVSRCQVLAERLSWLMPTLPIFSYRFVIRLLMSLMEV